MVQEEQCAGIAELKIASNPGVLVCPALGSCVAIILYEPDLKVGALAHIMLPDSKEIKKNNNSSKFVDTAIRAMIKALRIKGAQKKNLVAKIVGGAHMFTTENSFVDNIGLRNVMATKAILHYERIPIVAEDTGEGYGRTAKFYATDGKVVVSSVKGKKTI